jgi:hypothetical protein
MVVIISKTFTTAETMLNARTCRAWLTAQLGAHAHTRVGAPTCLPLTHTCAAGRDRGPAPWQNVRSVPVSPTEVGAA